MTKHTAPKFHFMRDNYKSFPVYVIPYDKEGRYHEGDAVGIIKKTESGRIMFDGYSVEELEEILGEMKEMSK